MITKITNKLHNAVDELSKQINDLNKNINVRIYGQYFVDKAAEYVNYSEAKDLRASCSRQFLYDL